MTAELEIFQNIPVTSAAIASCFPNIKQSKIKLRLLEQAGEIINLKKGLYVVAPTVTKKALSTELIANHLYGPSFLSQSSALRYYGLIPELVYLTQSMTIKHSRNFDTPVGAFQYTMISRESFAIGVQSVQEDTYSFLIATPERALCDLIAHTPYVYLRSTLDAATYLEEDLRLDMDAFFAMDKQIFRDYMAVGKKNTSIHTILKLLES